MRRQITIELDEGTAQELERIAPSRARKRSEFVRRALRQALDAEAVRRMAQAYLLRPDDAKRERTDPEAWEPQSSAPLASRSTGRS